MPENKSPIAISEDQDEVIVVQDLKVALQDALSLLVYTLMRIKSDLLAKVVDIDNSKDYALAYKEGYVVSTSQVAGLLSVLELIPLPDFEVRDSPEDIKRNVLSMLRTLGLRKSVLMPISPIAHMPDFDGLTRFESLFKEIGILNSITDEVKKHGITVEETEVQEDAKIEENKEYDDLADRFRILREMAEAALASQQAILLAYDRSNRFYPQYDADLSVKCLREGMGQLRASLEQQNELLKSLNGDSNV